MWQPRTELPVRWEILPTRAETYSLHPLHAHASKVECFSDDISSSYCNTHTLHVSFVFVYFTRISTATAARDPTTGALLESSGFERIYWGGLIVRARVFLSTTYVYAWCFNTEIVSAYSLSAPIVPFLRSSATRGTEYLRDTTRSQVSCLLHDR